MKKNNLLFLLLLFQNAFSQEKMIHGQIFGMGNSVEGINIVNLVNEKSAISDARGEFHIIAQPDDMLIFSAMTFEYKRRIITPEDMRSSLLVISLEPKPNQLEEVVIAKYVNINAVDLGIIKKHIKEPTPAERRLNSARSGMITGLINSINGTTASLKKGVEVEGKELVIDKFADDYFEPSYFTEVLKIDPEKVKAFQYYCAEDARFMKAVKSQNKTLATFWINDLAIQYNLLQKTNIFEK